MNNIQLYLTSINVGSKTSRRVYPVTWWFEPGPNAAELHCNSYINVATLLQIYMPLKLRLSETEQINFISLSLLYFGVKKVKATQKTNFICCYGILFILEKDKANVPPDKKATVFFPTASIPEGGPISTPVTVESLLKHCSMLMAIYLSL